jgi:hypothetical protein
VAVTGNGVGVPNVKGVFVGTGVMVGTGVKSGVGVGGRGVPVRTGVAVSAVGTGVVVRGVGEGPAVVTTGVAVAPPGVTEGAVGTGVVVRGVRVAPAVGMGGVPVTTGVPPVPIGVGNVIEGVTGVALMGLVIVLFSEQPAAAARRMIHAARRTVRTMRVS